MPEARYDTGDINPESSPSVTRLLPENKPAYKSRRTSRISRLLRSLLIFLVGLLLGAFITLICLLSLSGSNAPITTGASSNQLGNVVVQVRPSAILPLIQKSFQQSGMVGEISNLSLQLATGDQATLTGNYTFDILGFSITRPFTVMAQPLAQQCRLHIRILRAALSGISITQWVTSFENTINQQLESFSQSRSASIRYCITGVQTNPTALSLILQVTTLSA